jgi:hypothetical protein
VGAAHFHTSAKLNKGIEEMFRELTKRRFALFLSAGCRGPAVACKGLPDVRSPR